MTSRFDPSAFLAAEQSQLSPAVATVADAWAWEPKQPKTAEMREFEPAPAASVATIAAIAGVHAENLPWSAEVMRFVDRPAPGGVRPEAWDELVGEVWDIHRNWGSQALELGWSALDLFGCNPDPSARRVDRDGLVVAIAGILTPLRVTLIERDHALLSDHRGNVLRHRRQRAAGGVLLWEAFPMTTGP